MSEPTIEELTAEITTLRSVKDELLAKTHAQKATIATLEVERNTASEAADRAKETMRAVVIDKPVRAMVAKLCSAAPDLLLRELQTDFSFTADDSGNVIISTKGDGKPVVAKDGKPVPFESHAFHKFIIGDGYAEKNERQKMYTHLVHVPTASGGGAPLSKRLTELGKEAPEKIVFGLR